MGVTKNTHQLLNGQLWFLKDIINLHQVNQKVFLFDSSFLSFFFFILICFGNFILIIAWNLIQIESDFEAENDKTLLDYFLNQKNVLSRNNCSDSSSNSDDNSSNDDSSAKEIVRERNNVKREADQAASLSTLEVDVDGSLSTHETVAHNNKDSHVDRNSAEDESMHVDRNNVEDESESGEDAGWVHVKHDSSVRAQTKRKKRSESKKTSDVRSDSDFASSATTATNNGSRNDEAVDDKVDKSSTLPNRNENGEKVRKKKKRPKKSTDESNNNNIDDNDIDLER